MALKVKTRIFNISSKNTSLNDSFKSKLSISLPDLSFHERVENIYFSVQHAEIPNSFYVVNYTNNNIVINSVIYTIPVGNYNALNLITALNILIPSYTITYSSITNRYTFTNATAFTINASSTSKNIIGLGDINQTAVLSGSVYNLTLPYSVNFVPLPRISFKSNFFNFNNFNGINNSNDLFLSIQNNTNPNSMIHYVNETGIRFRVQDKNITTFIISITDDDGNFINFNNQDTRLSLQIDTEYIDLLNNTLTFDNLIKGK